MIGFSLQLCSVHLLPARGSVQPTVIVGLIFVVDIPPLSQGTRVHIAYTEYWQRGFSSAYESGAFLGISGFGGRRARFFGRGFLDVSLGTECTRYRVFRIGGRD